MGILTTYKAYKNYEPQYEDWNNRRKIDESKCEVLNKNGVKFDVKNAELAQKKAKVVANSMILIDNFAQTKAEDVETVFQTIQMELFAGLSFLISIPILIPKLIPTLKKHSSKAKIIKGAHDLIDRFDKANFKLGKINIPLKQACIAFSAAISSAIFVPVVTNAVVNQLGATRRAKFEGMNKDFSNIKDFAILTDEQEKQVQSIKNSSKKTVDDPKSKTKEKVKEIVSEAIDRVNIPKSMNSVKSLLDDKNVYIENKNKYDASLKDCENNFNKPLSSEEIDVAKADKKLFETLIKKVDLESQDPLEKIEKIVNIGYSSLFVGGYLEYLLSDKLVEMMKVKNPILKNVLSFGIPLVTYMILNKNLANFQNNAIKTVRYKKVNEFVNNKDNFNLYSQDQIDSVSDSSVKPKQTEKVGLFKFLKNMIKDINEYKVCQKTALEDSKKYLAAKRQIELTKEQEQDAKQLQKNAFMAINRVDDKNQKYAESVETISEIILAPVEILSTFVGAKLGDKIAKAVKTERYAKLLTGLGAVVLFIPAALSEYYLTAMQRNSLRISSMLASKELDDHRRFANYDDKSFKQQFDSSYAFSSKSMSNSFANFKQKLKKD